MSYEILSLQYYPVKSLGAMHSESVILDDFGFQNDRRFMLIDENNKFVTQRYHPKLSFLSATLTKAHLVISGDEVGVLRFMLNDFAGCQKVDVWGDVVDASVVDNKLTAVLSDFIGLTIRIAFIPDSSFRQVDREFYPADQRVSFVDAFPVLLTNEASLSDLNEKLASPIGMNRFRPNIVFSGDIPFQEDAWEKILIGDLSFKLVKPCSRCIMTTIDDKGLTSKEPLKTLSKYRRNEFGVCFGQNMVHLNTGVLSVGDRLIVK